MSIKKIPCGGFYVDNDAIETRDGKPYLKTGGYDPIVENAKATGGIGWTESGGRATIMDEVTATSDNLSTYVMLPHRVIDIEELHTAVEDSDIVVVYNGTEYNDCYIDTDEDGYYLYVKIGDSYVALLTDVSGNNMLYTGAPSTTATCAVYVNAGDIIHKIDPKYISGGGGGADVVIKATYDDYGRNPVATLVTGSFSSLATKLSNFAPATVQLVCETRDEDMNESHCLNVPCRVITTGDFSDITNISFIAIEPFMGDIAVCVPITYIAFTSDNTVTAYTS